MSDIREQVRERYARAATQAGDGCCGDGCGCGTAGDDAGFGVALYDSADLLGVPLEAQQVSLGCGNPLAVADLREGERVLDLGSGGGIDVLLSARRVGPTGFVHGVDMTVEMLDLARTNAQKAGATNVAFHQGTIEDLPLDDASVDVVISNCVVNLSPDKPAVLSEVYRVLVPGGRVGISDVVAEDRLTAEQRAERGSHVGCIAGALSRQEYLDGLAAAGFVDADVAFTHEVADGMHGAIVRATKPGPEGTAGAAAADGCCDASTQAACCEPQDKATCCGGPAGTQGSCGCQ